MQFVLVRHSPNQSVINNDTMHTSEWGTVRSISFRGSKFSWFGKLRQICWLIFLYQHNVRLLNLAIFHG